MKQEETCQIDEELREKEFQTKLENEDKKQDAQRNMAWVALIGMVAYPLMSVFLDHFGYNSEILVKMADLYFIASAGIVAAFYGKEAYMSKKQ